MLKTNGVFTAVVLAAAVSVLASGGALAQKGKIVCWKDKSGKVVGCGDTVPPEFQDSATKELDKRGVTRKTTETAEERARREAQEKAEAAKRAEEKRRLAEQRRQDTALLNTFSSEAEIDLKRDRELQVIDTQLKQLHVAQKAAADRLAEVKGRAKGADKEDLARAQADVARATQNIANKEKEKSQIRKEYAEMRARYTVLRGGGAPAATAAAKK